MISREEALRAIDRHDDELAERLRDVQARLEAAQQALVEAKEMRAGVIGEAVSDGWSLGRVAEVLGMSRQRAQQIHANKD